MTETGAGTVIMIAVAAGLWFLYLVPTWVRRREYLATERTATRLQQTMRIMAETAEVPEAVRVEVRAREAARQERILRAQQRREDALAARQLEAIRRATPRLDAPVAGRMAASPATTIVARRTTGPAARAAAAAVRRARMRRTRAIASLVLLTATAVTLVQLWLMASTGIVAGSWLVLGAALGAGALAIAVQSRLDAVGAALVARPRRASAPVLADLAEASASTPRAWTPVPVPPPLYLARPATERRAADPDAARVLRDAALRAEEALRAARAEPEVVEFRPSRYASMGIVDPFAVSTPDLDAALRRRRSAG